MAMRNDQPAEAESIETGGEDDRYAFDIPLVEVASTRIQAFDLYWRGKCRDGRLPARADLDPGEIKALLPSLVILGVEWAPFRVRIRLAGTRTTQYRTDNTGKYLDEVTTIPPARRAQYVAEMRAVAERAKPAFARDRMTTRGGASYDVFAGIWPLAENGRAVDRLAVMEDFTAAAPEEG
jgi:hypothetical protein